ncbi:hypothetical protein TDB9533_04419 [Thalassocella blandensis]|nr:hypothetical protein TDB9533_04419 [Thalassocella blandensis]
MSISHRIIKIVFLASILILFAGCNTDFDKFEASVLKGLDSSEIESALNKLELSFRFLTCLELNEEISTIKQGCIDAESRGVYVGWVNNGAYMLGMGSTDIYFEIEIGKNSKVVGVYKDEIYTFL